MIKTQESQNPDKAQKSTFVSLQRLVYTEEQKEKIRYMKENAKTWTIDESKLSEEQKMQQKIFDTLNKLTMDNYEEFRPDLVCYLSDFRSSKYMGDCIVNKALNEKMYTHLFCNIIKFLIDKNVKIKSPET